MWVVLVKSGIHIMFIQMWVVNIIATWLIKLAIPDIDTLAKTNMASENAPPPFKRRFLAWKPSFLRSMSVSFEG